MRREALMPLAAVALLASGGCSRFERLSIIKPTAARGDYTQVAPTYEVSDKGRKARPAVAAQLLDEAARAYRAGQLKQAEQLARQALKTDSRSGDAHTLLAAIASAGGDSAGAGAHYRQAVSIAPDTGAYANNYGTWLCANGRPAESLGWFDKALADPAYATPVAALANAGACANLAGQQDRAEANWRQALTRDPRNLQALSGMAALAFANGNSMEARAFVERWLALAPTDPDGLLLGSRIEQKLGDKMAAERYLSRLQAISPGTPTASPAR